MAKKAATSSRGSKPRKGSRSLKRLNPSRKSLGFHYPVAQAIADALTIAHELAIMADRFEMALNRIRKLSTPGTILTKIMDFSIRPYVSNGAIRTAPGSSKRPASPKSRFVREDGRLA